MSDKAIRQEFPRLSHAQQLQLEERKKRFLEGKSKGRSWSEVKASLLKSKES